jgi:hypothetical protein
MEAGRHGEDVAQLDLILVGDRVLEIGTIGPDDVLDRTIKADLPLTDEIAGEQADQRLGD